MEVFTILTKWLMARLLCTTKKQVASLLYFSFHKKEKTSYFYSNKQFPIQQGGKPQKKQKLKDSSMKEHPFLSLFHVTRSKLILFIVLIAQPKLYAYEFFDFDFVPVAKQKRFQLVDDANTYSIVSSRLSYGFGVDYHLKINRHNEFLIGFHQSSVSLEKPSNATIAIDEISYMNGKLFYEYFGRTFKLRLGTEYHREFYLNINNNVVTPEKIQTAYYVVGLYVIGKIYYGTKIYVGGDYASAYSSSDVNGSEVTTARYFQYNTEFVIDRKFIDFVINVYYRNSQIKYENIEQTIPELGLSLGVRF
tara:strand:- start:29656 stop:30573 length:918 start_codon:yes stop_codon:yes gene_type:complete